ncbi:MAG: type II toxin-antitoxin system prevent-host-death family antitoxin [Gemmatimonadota bacterium]
MPTLLRRVEKGERITITRHGRPVARLVPFRHESSATASEAVAAVREFARGRRLGPDLTVRALIDEGRR